MITTSLLNTVSARELQRDYKSVFSKVQKTKKPIIVISNNQPQAVIVSLDSFNELSENLNRQLLWDTITSIQSRNLDKNPEEVERDVMDAIKRVRMKMYAKATSRSRQQRNR